MLTASSAATYLNIRLATSYDSVVTLLERDFDGRRYLGLLNETLAFLGDSFRVLPIFEQDILVRFDVYNPEQDVHIVSCAPDNWFA